jgi:YfiH family protein
MTTRAGGVSEGVWASLNLGDHVGDDPSHVAANRAQVAQLWAASAVQGSGQPVSAPWPVAWLRQVHGNHVHRLTRADVRAGAVPVIEADGVMTTERGLVCAVMVADCLPILLAAPQGRGVAALHAGWRGLAGCDAMGGRGIVEVGVSQLCAATGSQPGDLVVWLGPCIGPSAFQVGAEVLTAFGVDPQAADLGPHFRVDEGSAPGARRWWADLAGLARARLQSLGVGVVQGGEWCTVSSPERFFSYRRDGVTGRQAALIGLR